MRVLIWAAGLALMGGDLAAAEPSFDCAKARGTVERMICGDADLAALDVELARVYRLARGGAALVAEERAWIAARDGCADRDCAREAYAARITALRLSRPGAARDEAGISVGPFLARCEGTDTPITVTFFNGPESIVYLRGRDQSRVLAVGRSASGARYVGDGPEGETVFWVKGDSARFDRPGAASLTCALVPMG